MTTERRKIKYLILAVFLLVLLPIPVRAEQSISVNDINFGIAGEDDFFNGYILVQSHPIFWSSDTGWRITVHSADPNLGVSDDGTYVKPLSDLLWKLSDEEAWIPMTQDPEEVDWSENGGEGVIYVDFAIQLDWHRDFPGHYEAHLFFFIQDL